jgi:hypothetical protein
MVVSGTNLSLFGRSAIAGAAGGRASQRAAPEQVEPTEPLKDPTSQEYRESQELTARDREVRQHEQAHVATGGENIRGGATYSYERGTDARQYANGGEVDIDITPIAKAQAATIWQVQVVRRAALAAAEPSTQHRAVPADASRKEAEVRVDLRGEQREGSVVAAEESHATRSVDWGGVPKNISAITAYRFVAASGSAIASGDRNVDLTA